MTKMKCRQCEHFEECRSKNIILGVTTSDDNWQNPWEHVYVFGLNKEVPSYCHYEKESLDWINRVIIEDTKMNKKEFYPNANWIPCSERLPEDIKPVIVTWKNNNPPFYYQHIVGEHFTGVAHYKNNKWFWYSSVTEDVLAEYGRCDSEEIDGAIEVVAWMPLPQPWKGEE